MFDWQKAAGVPKFDLCKQTIHRLPCSFYPQPILMDSHRCLLGVSPFYEHKMLGFIDLKCYFFSWASEIQFSPVEIGGKHPRIHRVSTCFNHPAGQPSTSFHILFVRRAKEGSSDHHQHGGPRRHRRLGHW